MTPGRTASVLVLLAWLAAAHGAAAGQVPGLADLDTCLRRLDPQADIGYDRIAARCPELIQQMQQSGWSKWLPHGWRESGNDLSAGGLQELRDLADRELRTTLPERMPQVQSLKSILSGLDEARAGHVTPWTRFKKWLRSIFELRAQPQNDGWLTRMIARVGFSQSMLDLFSYAALAAVVALAVFIILNELRAADLLQRRLSGARGRRGARAGGAVERGWEDVQQAPPSDRPRLLLELIATRLAGPPFLPPSRALTVRELVRSAPVSGADDRARLAELASAAERVRFSGREVSVEVLEAPLMRGRELLDRLTARADP